MSMFKRLQLDRVIDAKLIIAAMAGVIVAGGLLFAGRVAFGTIPDAGGDIQACFITRSGKLRVIDTDAGQTCNDRETAISWRQVGSQTGEVPQGGVVFYDSTSCPAGWSEYTPARGRTVVGLQPGGTLNGTVGSALANQENRAHNHGLTSSSGSHFHFVNPPPTATTIFGSSSQDVEGFTDSSRFIINSAGHLHDVDIGTFSSGSAGGHNHLTGDGVTASVMPYLQLLACEKD